MSWSASNKEKRCVTCANWAGPRVAKSNNTFSETESPSVRGKCYANVFCSVTQGPTASAGLSCIKYQKWSALK